MSKKCLCGLPADMVELVDTLDLGSSAVRCVGSTPSIRTKLTLKSELFYVNYFATILGLRGLFLTTYVIKLVLVDKIIPMFN